MEFVWYCSIRGFGTQCWLLRISSIFPTDPAASKDLWLESSSLVGKQAVEVSDYSFFNVAFSEY